MPVRLSRAVTGCRFGPDADLPGSVGEPQLEARRGAHLPQTRVTIRVTVELVAFDGLRAGSWRIHRLEHGIQPHTTDERADDRTRRAGNGEVILALVRLQNLVRQHAMPCAPRVGEGAELVFHRIHHAPAFAAVDVDIGTRVDGGRAAHDKLEIVFLLAPRAIQSEVGGGASIDVIGVGDNQVHHDGVLLSWITVRSKPKPFHCTWCSPAGNGWKI